jgi:hypothetical protein
MSESSVSSDRKPDSNTGMQIPYELIIIIDHWDPITNTAVRQVLPRLSHAFSTFLTARMPIWISMMASCRHTPEHGETLDVFWSFGSPTEVLKMRIR